MILILKTSLIPEGKLNETGSNLGAQAIDVEVKQEPVHRITGALCARHALVTLPVDPIVPTALVEGSRAELDSVIGYMRSKFGEDSAHYKEWIQWAATDAPQNDNVVDYMAMHPQLYPLSFEKLFLRPGSGEVLDSDPFSTELSLRPKRSLQNEPLLQAVSTDSLRTSANRVWVSPFVWKDTGAPVFKRRTRQKIDNDKAADVTAGDLLAPRDYKLLSNKQLVDLIQKINQTYRLQPLVKSFGKKDVLVECVQSAVARAKAVIPNPEEVLINANAAVMPADDEETTSEVDEDNDESDMDD